MAAKPVVVGVDGSEASLHAVEWAAREAERRKSPLRIVSVPEMPPRMREEPGTPTVSTSLTEYAERTLESAITRSKELAPGLVAEGELVTGAPAVVMTEAGSDALMVVVGARGVGGFAALLLGSVSRYVAMHASCPVVVIRAETAADVQREIAVGIRDPSEGTEALTFAFEEAALSGAELVAVHSGHGHDTSPEITRTLEETLQEWRDKYPAVAVRPDVVHGHPAQVLAEYSARADLVVLGRHGKSGVIPAIGSKQHAVLNHARGSVAIVPES